MRILVRVSALWFATSCGDNDGPGGSATQPTTGTTGTTGSKVPPPTSTGGTSAPTEPTGTTGTAGTAGTAETAETGGASSSGVDVDLCGNKSIDMGEECDDGEGNFPPDYKGDTYNACAYCKLVNTCGDGIVQEGHETCDCHEKGKGGEVCMLDSGTDCKLCQYYSRYVFVTSQRYHGNIGGLLSAAAKCKALADSSATKPFLKGRDWVAWLSDGCLAPIDRLSEEQDEGVDLGPYRLLDNTLVAESFSWLVKENHLLAEIRVDEEGTHIDPEVVWSNVTVAGTPHSPDEDCDNWDSGSDKYVGRMGHDGKTDDQWTLYNKEGWQTLKCDNDTGYRFYCFEQSALQAANSPGAPLPCP